MGSRGPISKSAQGRQSLGHSTGRRPRGALSVLDIADAEHPIPTPLADLGEAGLGAWESAFRSAPWLVSAADLQLAQLWADLHDERAELRQIVATTGREAKGSMGQATTAPAVDQLRQVEAELLKLASVLGLGPLHQARLGVQIASAAMKGERYSERIAREIHEDRPDPRLLAMLEDAP